MSAPLAPPASIADLLTDQFYRWELRGRGWQMADEPIELEPPFRPFEGHALPPHFFRDDGVQGTLFSVLASKLLGKATNTRQSETDEQVEEPAARYIETRDDQIELQVQLPESYAPCQDVMEQCLSSLNYCRAALAFEVVGTEEGITAQIVAEVGDAEQVFPQLKAHFPEAVFNPTKNWLGESWTQNGRSAMGIREFGLRREFMMPLLSAGQLPIDPLVGLCGALEMLREGEAGIFQVLFQPVRNPWGESILRAVTSEDGDSFFENFPELIVQTKRKLSQPLYAVVARVAARGSEEVATWAIIKRLAGALRPFANPDGNELILLENEDYSDDAHEFDLLNRSSRRYGMLLNSDELVSLAHLPAAAVRSRKLRRLVKRTKEPPLIAAGEGVKIGENEHEGNITAIALRPEHRVRHMHVIGASGTGKSTLLLNLICQDINHGNGVAVLDPHGDLVDKVLSHIPRERYSDVILFDPSDELYPVGFNILSAHSNLEKNLLASDLVAVFRRLSTAWGDQMTSVLGNAILAFLESTKGGTLADLRRFLIEASFRKEFLGTVTDSEVLYYWEKEFPLLKSTNSVGPLLTRLNSFLRPKAIRYVVAQRQNRLDLGKIMDEGKILLCPLPQGLIGEENAHLLGALLVAKIHQLAISRQEKQAINRRPFFLYLDEFQHFATPTMATILSGVRKYNLGLVLAHHELQQIQRNDDLASAVMSHPCTRVCFRVGDEDARRLASGFSHFEPSDLQNLGTGEAIARIERADFDFNLKTILPPEVEMEDARERKATLQHLTRQQYGKPREEVEKDLAENRSEPPPERVDAFSRRMASAKSPEPPAPSPSPAETGAPTASSPPLPVQAPATFKEPLASASPKLRRRDPALPTRQGRGGETHKHLQEEIKSVAEDLGFLASIEAAVENSETSVDVLLKKGGYTVACEISVSGTIEYETRNAKKCLNAGYNHAAIICDDAEKLEKIKTSILSIADATQAARLGFYDANGFITWLRKEGPLHAPAVPQEQMRRGYRVKRTSVQLTEEERKQREEVIFKTMTKAVKKKPPR